MDIETQVALIGAKLDALHKNGGTFEGRSISSDPYIRRQKSLDVIIAYCAGGDTSLADTFDRLAAVEPIEPSAGGVFKKPPMPPEIEILAPEDPKRRAWVKSQAEAALLAEHDAKPKAKKILGPGIEWLESELRILPLGHPKRAPLQLELENLKRAKVENDTQRARQRATDAAALAARRAEIRRAAGISDE